MIDGFRQGFFRIVGGKKLAYLIASGEKKTMSEKKKSTEKPVFFSCLGQFKLIGGSIDHRLYCGCPKRCISILHTHST